MKAMVSRPYAKVLEEAFPQATFVKLYWYTD